jgi:hypothetical protein
MARQFYENWATWAKGVQQTMKSSGSSERLALVRIHNKVRLLGLDLIQAQLPIIPKHQRNASGVVAEAGRLVFPDSPDRQAGLIAAWRSSSSDVHGLGWGAMTGAPVLVGRAGGVGAFHTGGNLEETVEHFKAAFLLTEWAWARWDLLS